MVKIKRIALSICLITSILLPNFSFANQSLNETERKICEFLNYKKWKFFDWTDIELKEYNKIWNKNLNLGDFFIYKWDYFYSNFSDLITTDNYYKNNQKITRDEFYKNKNERYKKIISVDENSNKIKNENGEIIFITREIINSFEEKKEENVYPLAYDWENIYYLITSPL